MPIKSHHATTIAVLAVQGAFIEHRHRLDSLGASHFEIRKLQDLDKPFDGLILPGGESTVQGKLLKELGLFLPLQKMLQDGLPVLGTCAGAILLSNNIVGEGNPYFSTMPITLERNAYGRQLGSFFVEENFNNKKIPMTFIRAPKIIKADDKVEILAKVKDTPVAVKYKKQIAISFHPELGGSCVVHEYFLSLIK